MKKAKLFPVILFLTFGMASAQHLIRVNNNGFDPDYITLSDAIAAASDNDTIYVEGSATPYAGCTISKPLIIIGPGYFLDDNPKTQASGLEAKFSSALNFFTGSAGSTLMGCYCEAGVYVNTDSITLLRNYAGDVVFGNNTENSLIIQNYIRTGISNMAAVKNTVISNNIVGGNIILQNSIENVLITNNILFEYGGGGSILCSNATVRNNIICYSYGAMEGQGSTFFNNLLASDGTDADGNQYNVDMSTVFVDYDGALEYSEDGKWKLKEGSPALGAGVGGTDCGVFEGSAPYGLSGLPNLPHIYEANVPATVNTGTTMEISIKVKSGD